jgi:hypothetical protein
MDSFLHLSLAGQMTAHGVGSSTCSVLVHPALLQPGGSMEAAGRNGQPCDPASLSR